MKKTLFIVVFIILPLAALSAAQQKADKFVVPIMGGNIDEVKRLINAGIDVNDKFNFGMEHDITALVFAVMLGQYEICKVLIDSGADVNVLSSGGMTLLHQVALSRGDYKKIAELLIENGLDVNAKVQKVDQAKDSTPLLIAAARGNILVVEVLIKNGADVNARLPSSGYSALHFVSADGNVKIVELLLAKNVEVNALTKYGETPLDLAISKGHDEVADLLRKHGGIREKK